LWIYGDSFDDDHRPRILTAHYWNRDHRQRESPHPLRSRAARDLRSLGQSGASRPKTSLRSSAFSLRCLRQPSSRSGRPLSFPPTSAGRTVCAGGNERGDAFEEGRRRKHVTGGNARSEPPDSNASGSPAQCAGFRRGRRPRMAFTLFAVSVSARSLLGLCSVSARSPLGLRSVSARSPLGLRSVTATDRHRF